MENKKELINFLQQFVTPKRYETFQNVIKYRTRYVSVALEDIYQPHNASAVLRSCDCFGVQDVHIIENKNQYRINPDVALGASKWLNLYSYNQKENNTLEAIRILRNKGYRIVATTPHTNDITLDDFDEEKSKFVLFFGTELQGLSKLMMDNADEYLKIPMYGFTESFNISVSAALTMHHLSEKIRKTKSVNWQLTDDEKDEIILDWLRTTIKHSDEIITQFYKNKK